MCQINYNKKKKYKHLLFEERLQIERWLYKDKIKIKEIAIRLDKSVRTIQREIKRGLVSQLTSLYEEVKLYRADVAQKKYDDHKLDKGPDLKIGKDHKFKAYLEKSLVEDKLSVEAAIANIRNKNLSFETKISARTIRNYIKNGLVFDLDKDLGIYDVKRPKKQRRASLRSRVPKSKNINNRPNIIESRVEYGHWEGDTIIGPREGINAVLLTLTERKTREIIILKIARKTSEEVVRAVNKLERRYVSKFSETFKTITFDNGSEFLNYSEIEQSIINKKQRTEVYYANPYCSWERGSNENNNRLVRRWFPKGTNFNKITHASIKKVEDWINDYPRKIFNYKSSNMILSN